MDWIVKTCTYCFITMIKKMEYFRRYFCLILGKVKFVEIVPKTFFGISFHLQSTTASNRRTPKTLKVENTPHAN